MEKELLNNIKNLAIDVINADVSIFYNEKYEKPVVFYNGKFDIEENSGYVKITQHRSEKSHKIINIVGTIIINDVAYKNSREEDIPFVRIVLPTLDKFDCKIKGVSSDISIEDVTIDELEVKTVSGDVDITDAIIGNTNIETTAGDVDLEIDDTEYSYSIDTNVVAGSIEVGEIDMSTTKETKNLIVKTVAGDITISGS